jgi:hypothetical protein
MNLGAHNVRKYEETPFERPLLVERQVRAARQQSAHNAHNLLK